MVTKIIPLFEVSSLNINWFLILVPQYEKPHLEECMIQGDIVCKHNNISKKSEEIDIENGPFVEGDIIPSHSQLLHKNINIVKWPNATVPFVFNKNIGKYVHKRLAHKILIFQR